MENFIFLCSTNSSAVSISTDEVISHNKGVDSAYWVVNSNSNCSFSSVSAVSSHAATLNFGFVDREKLRFSHNVDRRAEGKTEMMCSKPPSNERKDLSLDFTTTSNITSDASLKRSRAFCQGQKSRRPWRALEKKDHIYVLELKAAKYAIFSFTCMYPKVKSIHIQIDNIVSLSYVIKIGGKQNKTLITLSKEIWEYLLIREIMVTA